LLGFKARRRAPLKFVFTDQRQFIASDQIAHIRQEALDVFLFSGTS
jgi:hypothetical protein